MRPLRCRVRQIELILELGVRLDRVRRLPFIAADLCGLQGPAQRLGWYDWAAFLSSFAALKSLRRVEVFLQHRAARKPS